MTRQRGEAGAQKPSLQGRLGPRGRRPQGDGADGDRPTKNGGDQDHGEDGTGTQGDRS